MSKSKVPLNQIYRQKRTFMDYPIIEKTFNEFTDFTMKTKFQRTVGGYNYPKGRRYDAAVLFNSNVDFNGKIVCELGARDGIFGAWLTQFVDKIYISDYFEEWGKGTEHDLGQIDYWKNIWVNAAPNPEKMQIETQNMLKLNYPDNFFDIVVCTSVIEHLYNQSNWQGDIIAIKEIVRICKPGGIILLSTDMSPKESKWVSGTFYYNQKDLFERLINNSGCELRGDFDFDFNNPENDALTEHNGFSPVSSVLFSLKKPL